MGNVQMEARQIRYGSTNVEQALNNGGGGGGASTLAALTDTDISNPTNGQLLQYNGTANKWENASLSGVSLADLSDVSITDAADNQILKYDATAGKWKNYTVPVQLVKATPNMTSATTPSGVASASTEYSSSYAAWYAFSGTPGVDAQTWVSASGHTVGEWLQYQFPAAVAIKKISVTNRGEGNVRAIKTFKIQGSNNGTDFTDIETCTMSAGTSSYTQEFTLNNDTEYTYYRMLVVEPWIADDSNVGVALLDLYKEVSPI